MPSESETQISVTRGPKRVRQKPYRVTIELEAVLDYMSMLRGMTAHGKFYDGFNSDQLTRFPAFDGSEWDPLLPEGKDFQTFLAEAIEGNYGKSEGLFNRVRLYSHAQQNLALLLKRDAQVTLIIPESFTKYVPQINRFLESRFPHIDIKKQFEITTTSKLKSNKASDLWVVRSPEAAERLIDQGIPFILIDGKENAHIENARRVAGWYQAGFLLRHGQAIDRLAKKHAESTTISPRTPGTRERNHLDIWVGYAVVALPVDEELSVLSSQRKSLLHVKNHPDIHLRFDQTPEDGDGPRKPYPPELKKKVLKIIDADLVEVERRIDVLRAISQEQFETQLQNPEWTSKVNEREENMSHRLGGLVKTRKSTVRRPRNQPRKTRRVPADITAKDLAARIVNGKPEEPITLRLSGSDVIHALADNWGVVLLEKYEGGSDNIAGHLGELVTLLLVKQAGWKLLLPKKEANGQDLASKVSRHLPKFMRHPGQEVSRVSEFSRVQVSWTDLLTHEPKTAEVDFIAKGPDNFYVIGEVKLTSQSELSDSQRDLRDHIAKGGRVDNPDLPGLRYKTFKPNWREIHIDDGPSRNQAIDFIIRF